MQLPFLQFFPREIRDQIYTYVLASPSGAVSLSPWTLEVARSLSVLRTCKQVHRECKDIIWLHNGLSLREPTQLFQKLARMGAKGKHIRRIRQFNISLELLDRDELEWISASLKGLEDWCRLGRLESITISTVSDRPRGLEEFKDVLNMRKYGERLDGRLYRELSSWTRMTVNTGWPRFSHWGKQRWLREMLLDPSGIEELLKEMHHTFGGVLYVDGRLCFKDGLQMETSALDPRNGEIRIEPGAAFRDSVDSSVRSVFFY